MEPENIKSLVSVAHLAMQESRAYGFAVYGRIGETGFTPLYEFNASEIKGADASRVVSLALKIAKKEVGKLVYLFREADVSRGDREILEQASRTVEAIWSLFDRSEALVQMARRVARLQAEVADLKIAERARGFVQNRRPNAIGIISHHVDNVLRAQRLPGLLEDLAHDLEHELAERALISRAKDLLQNSHGISEDQAYALLRSNSRKSRRKIGAVARQLVGAQPSP